MTPDTVHVVTGEEGHPIAVTPDHDVAIDALTAAGGDAVLWEDVDVIGGDDALSPAEYEADLRERAEAGADP